MQPDYTHGDPANVAKKQPYTCMSIYMHVNNVQYAQECSSLVNSSLYTCAWRNSFRGTHFMLFVVIV